MGTLLIEAPEGELSGYDRGNLLTYAELLDADAAGVDWKAGSLSILDIDPGIEADAAHHCWDSHLVRARWITGDGLADAVETYGHMSFGHPASQSAG